MFFNFKDSLDCNSLMERAQVLLRIKEYDDKKNDSKRYAKVLVSNIADDVYVLSQFFNITPKIGVYGDTSCIGDVSKVRMNPSFMKGFCIEFFVAVDGVKGFSIIKEEGAKDE